MFRKSCLLLLVIFVACKKDPGPIPAKMLSGTWQGKYGISSSPAPGDTVLGDFTNNYMIVFRENGTMTVYDGLEDAILMAEGIYSLKGGKLLGEYTYVRGSTSNFSIQGTVHKADSLAGIWRIGSWGRTGGKFYVKKL